MIAMDRKDLALMMECGYILTGMRRFDEARDVFEGIAVLAPESAIPVVAIGSVAFCEGKFKEAIKTYQKALHIEPQSAFAKAYLGESLYFSGAAEEAQRLLTEVVAADGQGKAGTFAATLLSAMAQGLTPAMLAGTDDLAEYQARQAQAKSAAETGSGS